MVVNTPCALVVPETVPKLFGGAAGRQRHGRVETRLPWASSTVTVSVVVETPSAVTVAESLQGSRSSPRAHPD